MSKVYKINGGFTGYEYGMTFYDDCVEIGYNRHGTHSTLYTFPTTGDKYELDTIRDNDFTEAMFDEISQCGSLEEARDMATIAFEAEGLFDYVFENWGCPDCEY